MQPQSDGEGIDQQLLQWEQSTTDSNKVATLPPRYIYTSVKGQEQQQPVVLTVSSPQVAYVCDPMAGSVQEVEIDCDVPDPSSPIR